ncbi:PH domain-containing protein [Sinomonas gamaensis]|uniref:PH domain-containing protein n=1 Tax=Sinomonas gamaensis TaxID=2565624 RepID=UPI001109ED9F|nr:PH domain-containing protein [Sinomonas gamaensis]
MNDQPGKSGLHRFHFALLLVAAAVVLARLIRYRSDMGKTDGWLIGVCAVSAMVASFLVLIVVPAVRARRSAAAIRAQRPTAVVLTSYWAENSTAPFLKPGRLAEEAKGRGYFIQVIADENGLEVRRPLRHASFGTIPWSAVRDVHLEEFGSAGTRPKLVFALGANASPYADYFEVLPQGRKGQVFAEAFLASLPSMREHATHWSSSPHVLEAPVISRGRI